MSTDDWRSQAACLGKAEVFLVGELGSARDRTASKFNRMVSERAKKICDTCSVIDSCLDYALVHEIKYFVWGGLSWSERQKIIRIRRKNIPILVDPPPDAVAL